MSKNFVSRVFNRLCEVFGYVEYESKKVLAKQRNRIDRFIGRLIESRIE